MPGQPAPRCRASGHNRSRGLAGKNARNQSAVLIAVCPGAGPVLDREFQVLSSRACASASPGARAGRSQQLLRFAGLAGALDAMTGPGQGPGVWLTGSRSIRTAISARRAASTPAHTQRRHASPAAYGSLLLPGPGPK